MVNIGFDWIIYTQNIDCYRRNFLFSENKKQIRYIIMNLLSFSVTSNLHVIIAKKQLIKHDILTHCLTCNFRHMSQYNSFPSVWRGFTVLARPKRLGPFSTGTSVERESIIGVQWGQGNPNPRVNCSSGKRGFAEFPTGTVDPQVGISRFHCTPMIDSISHISNKNIFIFCGGVALARNVRI